jgi:hypothetical protein
MRVYFADVLCRRNKVNVTGFISIKFHTEVVLALVR